MVRTELRIVLAVIATFVALAGIAVALHGALYDRQNVLLYGGVATGVGMMVSAVLLNVWPRDMNDNP